MPAWIYAVRDLFSQVEVLYCSRKFETWNMGWIFHPFLCFDCFLLCCWFHSLYYPRIKTVPMESRDIWERKLLLHWKVWRGTIYIFLDWLWGLILFIMIVIFGWLRGLIHFVLRINFFKFKEIAIFLCCLFSFLNSFSLLINPNSRPSWVDLESWEYKALGENEFIIQGGYLPRI